MQTHSRHKSVAASIMKATDFHTAPALTFPMISMEKLNGLYCKYVADEGFFSKDGIRWADSVLSHIEAPVLMVDKKPRHVTCSGELYCEGMSLQEITRAVGVTRNEPGPGAERIHLHLFDIDTQQPAYMRKALLPRILGAGIVISPWQVVKNRAEMDAHLERISANPAAEGQMLLNYVSFPCAGKTRSLLKRKLYHDMEVEVVGRQEGEGEFRGMVGSLQCLTKFNGNMVGFSVGSGLTIDDRIAYWRQIPKTIKIRYDELSNDGIPLRPRFLCEEPF